MSEVKMDICDLIEKGGVFYNVPGSSAAHIYKYICSTVELPENLSSEQVYRELMSRDELISTAVGNGIAIPHPRHPLLKETSSQRIFLCFPLQPVDMKAPDGRLVTSLFILLTNGSRCHLDILSQLANLFQKTSVRHLLEHQAEKNTLLAEMRRCINGE